MLWAGGFALAELAAGLVVGQFALRGRAEIGIFLLFRPWLLLALALAALWRPAGERWALYAAAILLAGVSEGLLVHMLGAPLALGEVARAVLASVAVALLFDLVGLGAGRPRGWRGGALACAIGLGLLAAPGPIALYERVALPEEPPEPEAKPPLLLLTGLPLGWGEGGIGAALEGSADPAAFHAVLERAYAVRPIDVASPDALRGARLLLVAQARPPGPAGLVAIDQWVRRGGRALILTDPALRWPSRYPIGDPRRPPIDDGLGPLLAHWGLRLEPPGEGRALITRDLASRRLLMAAPGKFVAIGGACVVGDGGLGADCRIGRGRALLFADADMLHELLWAGPGAEGTRRAGRLADNPAYIFDRLDQLRGRTSRQGDLVRWIKSPESYNIAVPAAAFAPGATLLLGLYLLLRGRRSSPKKDSYRVIHSQEDETKKEQ